MYIYHAFQILRNIIFVCLKVTSSNISDKEVNTGGAILLLTLMKDEIRASTNKTSS